MLRPVISVILVLLSYLWFPTGVTLAALWTTFSLCVFLTLGTLVVIVPVYDTSMLTDALTVVSSVLSLGLNIFNAFYVPYNNWRVIGSIQLRKNEQDVELDDDELENLKAN